MLNQPDNNEIEVSLVGTGGGYGESVVIHLGNQNWMVVDSCLDPYEKKSIPLEYLKNKGVNISKDVKLIVCTHWHDDHILGISDLLEECVSAEFAMARSTDKEKFLLLVGLDYSKTKSNSSASSTKELYNCLEIIKRRNSKITKIGQDQLLFSDNKNQIFSEVLSLSPSHFVLDEYDKEISSLITNYGRSNQKIICHTPNDKSVALLIKVNNQEIILGSDLEVCLDERKGWLCILNDCKCIKSSKASIFKIPHHGSENGYHERIWKEIINENVIACLTPWNKGIMLPEKKMLRKYNDHTENLFITSLNYRGKAKKRNRSISKTINKFNNTLQEVKFNVGIIKCTFNINVIDANWNTVLYDKAVKVEDKHLE